MSEQSQEQNLSLTMQEMMDQMVAMRAELDSLKARTSARADVLPQRTIQAKPEISTTRRKVLRRLAGGLVAGLAVSGIGVSLPQDAEAKLSSNPSGYNLTGRVGMLVMPPGSTMSGALGNLSTKVGLLVSGDTSFNLNALGPTVNAAIIAYTSNNGTAISGFSQTGTAIYGKSDNNFAVRGESTSGNGVQGSSKSNHGVFGICNATTSNDTAGVYGTGYGHGNYGVKGANDDGIAVFGQSTTSFGVYGYSNTGYGVYANVGDKIYGKAGYFDGSVVINGYLDVSEVLTANFIIVDSIHKQSGSFKIDHPLDPANKYLYHSFVESPDMMNIYNGLVILDELGEATIEMPDWFEALNFDFRYQLTCLGEFSAVFIARKMKDRKFKIAGGKPGQEISWQVTGIRQDAWAKAHRIPVEEDKTGNEKGKYLAPEVFGKPEDMAVNTRVRAGSK